MSEESAPLIDTPARPPRPRFGWPMRLFLGFLVLDIVLHSFSSLTPYRHWADDFGMTREPERLPTWAEWHQAEASAEGGGGARVLDSMDAVWDFFKPWPEKQVRPHIKSWQDTGKFALCWVTTRLEFLECFTGTPQHWTMFSPNASRTARVARARLLYDDGSLRDIRMLADPADLTNYAHWWQEKTLDYELKVHDHDLDSCRGYCNYLAHQYPAAGSGARLTKIYIYEINYTLPHPDEDAFEKLRQQSGPPDWDRDGPFYHYDVASKRGRELDENERAAVQARLTGGQS